MRFAVHSELLRLLSVIVLLHESIQFTLKGRPDERSPAPNFMKEYMSRGLFECTADYLETIKELQKLIKKAYEKHEACQRQLEESEKSYPKTDFDIFNQLQDAWAAEDSREESEESSIESSTVSADSRDAVSADSRDAVSADSRDAVSADSRDTVARSRTDSPDTVRQSRKKRAHRRT